MIESLEEYLERIRLWASVQAPATRHPIEQQCKTIETCYEESIRRAQAQPAVETPRVPRAYMYSPREPLGLPIVALTRWCDHGDYWIETPLYE